MRRIVGTLIRLVHINSVLFRHGLDEVILATRLLRPIHFVHYLLPWNWFRTVQESRAVRVRKVLEDLGPIFVKFGQILSVRRDLLTEDLACELSKLQDAVPPFDGAQARAIIEAAYGYPLDQVFASFDEVPLASASIAQVHAATLRNGQDVIVKVVRPGIRGTIMRDVTIMHFIASRAERFWHEARRLRPREVVREYEETLLDELDMLREAASASQLRRNFERSDLLYVPEVHWPLTRRDVMVMERIRGIPVSNIEALDRAGIDKRELAERGVEIFFTQVFVDNFFHADMHPGNIFVSPLGEQKPRYIAVDFGIMGTLSSNDQQYLAENFVAFFNRDYRRVAELHIESGWVPSATRVDQFEAAIRSVCEPIFERPLKEISFGHLLVRLFQTARRFHMEVQPQLVLLQKTVLNIEGLGRQLYPDLDLWMTAKPFLDRWMKTQIGPRVALAELTRQAPQWGQMLPRIPNLAHDVLSQARRGELRLQLQSEQIDGLTRGLSQLGRRLVTAAAGGTSIISAAVLHAGYAPAVTIMFGPLPVSVWLLGLLGVLLLGWAWLCDR
ncbi:MAG: ubiquinone biosynthesis regulatory protein kinase UbiB [Gammaproteobacteria bacterium]|nr:ubiquinone biosynthesis regulatory protein kinase UbiB [Gammaproteobacteria bacterium]